MNNKKDYNQLKVVVYLYNETYGDIFNSVKNYLHAYDSFVLSRIEVIKNELNKYLPDRLAEFDIEAYIASLREKANEKKTNVKIFANNVEEAAMDQIKKLLEQEAFKYSKIRIMPDVHAGKSCVIGFTGDLGEKVIPSIVGVDIGCGMFCANLGNIEIDYQKLDEFIGNNIPSGQNVNDKKLANFDLTKLHCYNRLKNIEFLERSIGTLGGGNHFIEIDTDKNGEKYLIALLQLLK